jgi:Spy/CpxP family protein refolding chaperone
MKRLLVLTAAIALCTVAQLWAADEPRSAGNKEAAKPSNKERPAVNVWGGGFAGGKSAAQWYIESTEKIVPLSDAQKKAITEIMEARDKAIRDFQTENKEKLQAGVTALTEAFKSQDKEKIAQAQKAYQDLYAPMHEAMKKSQAALENVLTQEQRDKLLDNRATTWIKAMTDPAQLSDEQVKKLKAAYAEVSKAGERENWAKLSDTLENILTPEQKTTIFKHRTMGYVKAVYARAKLSDEQMKQVEALVAEQAKNAELKTQWQSFAKLQEKINALLTPEQKETVKTAYTWSATVTPAPGSSVQKNPAPANEKKAPATEKKEPGGEKKEPGVKVQKLGGEGIRFIISGGNLIIGEGGKAEAKPGQAAKPAENPPATRQRAAVNSGTRNINVWGGKSAAQWYIENTEKFVKLTEDQKKAITREFEARDKALQELQAQNKEKIEAAQKALGEAFKSQDKEKMAQTQKAYQEAYAPIHEAMKKSQKALDDVLTAEQRETVRQNQMVTWIKAVTDPVQLSPEQLEKARAIYGEFLKGRVGYTDRGLPEPIQKILTPEQMQTIFKHRMMLYAKGAFARAKLTDEQWKKVEAIVAELAKDADPKAQRAAYGKVLEKINGLLTAEQKEAMKAPIGWSLAPGTPVPGAGAGVGRLNPAPTRETREPAKEKKEPSGSIKLGEGTLTIHGGLHLTVGEGGRVVIKGAQAATPGEPLPKQGEPGLKVQELGGEGFQVIIGEGGKIEVRSPEARKPADNQPKKGEPGVKAQAFAVGEQSPRVRVEKLPGGGIRVILSEAGEGKEGQRREAMQALEKARHALEEQMKSAQPRMLERVKRQHELAEQAWQLAQKLQALEESKKAEIHELREKLEAVEGQLRGTFEPAVRVMSASPGWVQVQPRASGNVRPDPAVQEIRSQIQDLRRQVEELRAIVKKQAGAAK